MGERQPFRFRLPWLNMPAAPRPTTTVETEAPRSVAETQVPTRPAATVPVQRPLFRPPGIAPVQPPPPPPSSPPRNEPQPPTSPPRAAIESRTASQPASPPRLPTVTESQPASPLPTSVQSRAASLPPSPSRTAPQSRPASVSSSPSQSPLKTALQPQSPSRLAPQPAGRTSSQPSSPSRTATGVQPTAEGIFLPPPSSSKKLEPTTEVTTQFPRIFIQTASLATKQEEQEPALPQPDSQETQSKIEIRPETGADSQNQPPVETTTQPDVIATQQTEPSGLVSAVAPGTVLQPFPDSTENPEETKERPNLVQEKRKEIELNWSAKQNTVTAIPTVASNSETKINKQLIVDVKEQKELGKQEIFASTPDSNRRVFKTGNSTHLKERNHKPAFLNGERAPMHKEISDKPINDKPINVINLAGENRGASMQLGTESRNKERSMHIRRGYKINPDESVDATTDAEGSSRGRRSTDLMSKEDQATKAYINSNVQSINNSIVFNTSVSERNPGVQLNLSQNPTKPIMSNGKIESLETRKAEFNITPAEKLTYQPTVRRICLRGLLMEPSDSDPDNPDKPRRHGCWEKGTDEDIDIL